MHLNQIKQWKDSFRTRKLPVVRRAKLLGLSRRDTYILSVLFLDGELPITQRIDELLLDYPLAGSQILEGLLNAKAKLAVCPRH